MSKIFSPFRTLGVYSAEVPFVINERKVDNHYELIVSVGNRFNVYRLPKLRMVFIGNALDEKITCMAVLNKRLYVATGRQVHIYRNCRAHIKAIDMHESSIIQLTPLDDGNMASYDKMGELKVWKASSQEVLMLEKFDPAVFAISFIFHPDQYKNKFLLASFQGPLSLWNYKTQKQLYWFKGFGTGVVTITQAPSVDIVAIGLADGRTVIHNLRQDQTVLQFHQDSAGIVSIAFRFENPATVKDPNRDIYLFTGTNEGCLTSWVLKPDGRSQSVGCARELHWNRMIAIKSLLLHSADTGKLCNAVISQGADNSLKVCYFDRVDGMANLVYQRSGHFLPPNKIEFWPGGTASGNLLFSTGLDRQLRVFSTAIEGYERYFGQTIRPDTSIKPKKDKSHELSTRLKFLLPPVSALSMCAAKAECWDSLVLAHENKREVATWNFSRGVRGKHWLQPAKFHADGGKALRMHKTTVATCVCITPCGNFVLVGYSTGDIARFNIQSGEERGSFLDKDNHLTTAHDSGIVGVFTNVLCSMVISVASHAEERPKPAEVKFWDFNKVCKTGSLELTSTTSLVKYHIDGDLLAVALTSGHILVIDCVYQRVIRRLPELDQLQPVDMIFSPDAKWLVIANKPALIRTWDLVDGRLIDSFQVKDSPITSLAMCPTGEFLATTHDNNVGIVLWDNQASYKRVDLNPLPMSALNMTQQHDEVVALPSNAMSMSYRVRRNVDLDSDLDEDNPENDQAREAKRARHVESEAEDLDEDHYGDNDDADKEQCDQPMEQEITEELLVSSQTVYLNQSHFNEINVKPSNYKYTSPEQLPGSRPMITRVDKCKAYFSQLLEVEAIRQKNQLAMKPQTGAVLAQAEMPFFLPVKESTQGVVRDDTHNWFEEENEESARQAKRKSTIFDSIGLFPEQAPLVARLRQKSSGLDKKLVDQLKQLPAAHLDLFIQALVPEDVTSGLVTDFSGLVSCRSREECFKQLNCEETQCQDDNLFAFMRLLAECFSLGRDYDWLNACLKLVLRYHGEYMIGLSQLHDFAAATRHKHESVIVIEEESSPELAPWVKDPLPCLDRILVSRTLLQRELSSNLNQSLCLVDFIRNPISMAKL